MTTIELLFDAEPNIGVTRQPIKLTRMIARAPLPQVRGKGLDLSDDWTPPAVPSIACFAKPTAEEWAQRDPNNDGPTIDPKTGRIWGKLGTLSACWLNKQRECVKLSSDPRSYERAMNKPKTVLDENGQPVQIDVAVIAFEGGHAPLNMTSAQQIQAHYEGGKHTQAAADDIATAFSQVVYWVDEENDVVSYSGAIAPHRTARDVLQAESSGVSIDMLRLEGESFLSLLGVCHVNEGAFRSGIKTAPLAIMRAGVDASSAEPADVVRFISCPITEEPAVCKCEEVHIVAAAEGDPAQAVADALPADTPSNAPAPTLPAVMHWQALGQVEGVLTGDSGDSNRLLMLDAIEWPHLPIPLMMEHEGSIKSVVGTVWEVWRQRTGPTTADVYYRGTFDLGSDQGREAKRLVDEGVIARTSTGGRGPISYDIVMGTGETTSIIDADGVPEEYDASATYAFKRFTAGELSLVAGPAQAQTRIWSLDAAAQQGRVLSAALTRCEEINALEAFFAD
jgi:hypothetical protein